MNRLPLRSRTPASASLAEASAHPGTIPSSLSSSSSSGAGLRARVLALPRPRPELSLLIGLAGILNLWSFARNGWANDYYSAAVRSMSTSWHNFLFGSLDPSGVMTVDKPPLALWVQALSVRVFGFHSLSILVPQALMGVASVALVYDLVRRRFGRVGGFVAGLVLALTPITVAISRHNNPDAMLILCCVAALWFALRAFETGRTRWLVLCGVCVGLGFEAKMAVALMVVPGIAAAWLWVAPHGRLRALRELLAGGAAMVVVGGAWPALVALTPAADRPWISGTADNSIFSLIWNYNGVGRLEGQSGGPGGQGGSMFGGTPGPLRLLNSALGGQAGWLLGFALVSGVGILIASRLRRGDPRTGWLIATGGAFLTIAVVFSEAKGIFHPYYVSLLAPFSAALVGAGASQILRGGNWARILGPVAIVGATITELVVLHHEPGDLGWLPPVLIAVAVLAGLGLVAFGSARVRIALVSAALLALLAAPATWAVQTLGHATSGTFPAGGPAESGFGGPGGGGPGGGFGGPGGRAGAGGRPGAGGFGGPGSRSAGTPEGSAAPGGSAEGSGQPLFGNSSGSTAGAGAQSPPEGSARPRSGNSSGAAGGQAAGAARGGFGGRAGGGAIGAPFGNNQSIARIASYVKSHGGGTIAVSSQSSAASAILAQSADVAGIGGFSGRESDVSVSWLADEVSAGKIRWVLVEGSGSTATGGFGGGGAGRLPGDDRTGSTVAMDAAAQVCRKVTVPSGAGASTGTGSAAGGSESSTEASTSSSSETLYDCAGRASALLRLAGTGS